MWKWFAAGALVVLALLVLVVRALSISESDQRLQDAEAQMAGFRERFGGPDGGKP